TAKLDREAWDHVVTSYALPYFLLEKGKMDMAMSQPRAHDLGRALRAYADKNKMYPRGTKERGPSPVRMNRPWQPDEKISWMAAPPPFLHHEDLYKQIVQDKSWRDTENLGPAMTLVPYFLNRNTQAHEWHVKYPGVRGELAATHYVGVAGIGLDAADYTAQSPEYAKKRGVFGYDRETPLSDIGDGLSYTVLLLQV